MSESSDATTPVAGGLHEQMLARRDNLRKAGVPGFALGIPRAWTPGDLRARYDAVVADQLPHDVFATAARVVAIRAFGKAMFLRLQDHTGDLQIYCKQDKLGPGYDLARNLDLGDHVGVSGTLFRTKTHELTLEAHSLQLLTKALRPMPEKFHGLTDTETRYRKRYLDLMSNPESAERFRRRTQIMSLTRRFFEDRGFLEMETPMLQSVVAGAAARPFRTHHNTLDMPLNLRIAPELNLKRLLVGGFDKVFEMNRNFRNEGISIQHNPEFTMLEFYWAYARMENLIETIGDLFVRCAREFTGSAVVSYQGTELDFGHARVISVKELLDLELNPPMQVWVNSGEAARFCIGRGVPRMKVLTRLFETFNTSSLQENYYEFVGVPADAPHEDFVKKVASLSSDRMEVVLDIATRLAATSPHPMVLAAGIMHLAFEEFLEKTLIQPTFVTDFPTHVSPLARRKDEAPHLTDRFEFFVAGREIANGFNELNDPDDQRERFEFQVRYKERGDDEAMDYDADYIEALEHGMPPAAGAGIGMDRMVMLFTDAASIRDVILFPLQRPQAGH